MKKTLLLFTILLLSLPTCLKAQEPELLGLTAKESLKVLFLQLGADTLDFALALPIDKKQKDTMLILQVTDNEDFLLPDGSIANLDKQSWKLFFFKNKLIAYSNQYFKCADTLGTNDIQKLTYRQKYFYQEVIKRRAAYKNIGKEYFDNSDTTTFTFFTWDLKNKKVTMFYDDNKEHTFMRNITTFVRSKKDVENFVKKAEISVTRFNEQFFKCKEVTTAN